MLEVHYENRIGDQIYALLKSFFTRKSNLMFLAGFAFIVFATFFKPLPDSPGRFLAAIIASLLVFSVANGLIFGFVILTLWMKNNRSTDKGFLTEHRIVFSEAGYIEETSVNRTESKWEGVFALKKDSRFIFVYESPDRMHLIPRRAFNSDREYDEFFCGIESLKEGDNTKTAARPSNHASPEPASRG